MARRRKKPTRSPARDGQPAPVDQAAAGGWPAPAPVPVLNSRWDALMSLEGLASEARQAAAERDRGVAVARAAGATWVEVADALGVTRQAARQRYGS